MDNKIYFSNIGDPYKVEDMEVGTIPQGTYNSPEELLKAVKWKKKYNLPDGIEEYHDTSKYHILNSFPYIVKDDDAT